ncbi:MerR family transcriptional regulator [Gallicola sp. Sow4_E12]|uniref:MerR family transcriptional regulator n=1 Tax=Gallicola sp. Sow4_E12 TaxID=3438785 RepID=UPI003F9292D9
MSYLKIGQLSKLFKINKQTLQYYDKIKLLRPDDKDKKTGYRQYSSSQIYELATIRYLKKIGYSLDDISDYVKFKDPDKTLESLEQHSEILLKQSEELLKIRKAIERKINFTREKLIYLNTDITAVNIFPNRFYLPIEEDLLYRSDSFYFFPTIAFYENEFKSFGAYIGDRLEDIRRDSDYNTHDGELKVIPKGKYLYGYHVGPYENIMETTENMRQKYEDLYLDDKSVNFNIIDQFIETQKEKYITEIQIKVLED